MKIQGLAVIAMIIIIPMSIILNNYATSQIKTLQFQISYDSKLKNSTYDGIKALQLNMENSSTSDLANSKMRDIKAAIKTFYGSLASSFNMTGYGEDVLKNYVPAIVYTMYDGYYIYSEYNNKLSDDLKIEQDSKYQNGDEIYGLKPYIYYSCRYKPKGSDSDFTITYSLDSYITIQGVVNGKAVNESGYLLSGVTDDGKKYKNIDILQSENIVQNVIYDDNTLNAIDTTGGTSKFPQVRVNGVKYYKDGDKIFSMLNNSKMDATENEVNPDTITSNKTGLQYYKDAYNFKNSDVFKAIKDLSSDDAVDTEGNYYSEYQNGASPYTSGIKIFEEINNTTGKLIEDDDSDFSRHKKEVIKNAIESNLMVAIENYNKVSSVGVKFAMPKLNDTEWDEITNGISMITFLQGLNIGGKIYNGYAIVQNNVNDDYVSEDSIYIVGSDDKYYRATDKQLSGTVTPSFGARNTDFERKTIVDTYTDDGTKKGNTLTRNLYYYPLNNLGSYTSIVNRNSGNYTSISEALNNNASLAQIYYTALGRERYGMYRVQNKLEKVQEYLQNNGY